MKRMTMLCGAVLLTAALSALTGCVETAGTTVTTDHMTGSSLVMEDSTRLRDQIQILKVNYDEVNGLKRVHITLQSSKHRRLRLNYRIAWFDANGMEVDAATKTYRNLILEGRDTVTVTGLANSPACVTSKLRVRDLEAAD
ncbi:MAG TPA: YcfL family protein [Kiritimatiellia bacterium]|nr:YcfL family protein [Kiritimatiellia bacterium]HQL52365.1 YcfL family protein [Kiritimatiellia bacterium]